jgi:phage virion morphogenesis protein
MATQIKVEVLADKLQARLTGLRSKIQNMTPAYETIGRVLVNRIRFAFRNSTSPWGTPWAPLRYRKGKPLIDTGRLRRSIVYKATKNAVEIGTNVKYARVHQFGAKLKSRDQVLAFGKGGKFQSRRASRKAFYVVNVAFARIGEGYIPARPYMPVNPAGEINLPPAWGLGVLRELGKHFSFGTVKA